MRKALLIMFLWVFAGYAFANLSIPMKSLDAANSSIGMILAEDTPYGLLLTPKLVGLPKGVHGFHLHSMPLCGDKGQAAGGHFDPMQTKVHAGPYNANGHMGDLPVLVVNAKGEANLPVLAPRLKVNDLHNHSLVIHAGFDDYSEDGMKMSGDRIACGIVPWH